jgi:hypothetical protein
MSFLRLHIEQPHAPTEMIEVESEQVLIGSAAHCDVRLPPDHARPEHVRLYLGAGGALWARTLDFHPHPSLNGVPFEDAPVADGSVIAIGAVRVHVAMADDAAVLAARPLERKSNPVVVLGGLAAIAVLASSAAVSALQAKPPESRGVPPALFAKMATPCPRSEPRQALSSAGEKLTLARSKRERRPFSPGDGVAAVPLFETAAACFSAGGDEKASKESLQAADALRVEIERDYRTHQVRLDHAIGVDDATTALQEMDVLLALTAGQTGTYVTWLTVNHRRLKLQSDQAKKEK